MRPTLRPWRGLGVRALLLLTVALVVAPAGRARASIDQSATFQDNNLLLEEPGRLDPTLATLRSLGVDRLRITVEWDLIAPDPDARRMPAGFDGADPADYPRSGWAPYDAIVRQAARYGLGVNFNVTGGAPLWATGGVAPAASMNHVWYPSAAAFGAFVRAVGLRYSGRYTPPGASGPLPRVDYWSIWNEPNVGSSSLSPQTVDGVEVGPRLYRGLLDAAYRALTSTGHGHDTILIGELASTGHADPGAELGMEPLRFLRALYCVGSNYQPLRGSAAAARRCPTTAASGARFRAENPALFDASGFSEHPYRLDLPPDAPNPSSDPDWVTLVDLPKLERALDLTQHAYGSSTRFALYLTEYGLETNPPLPYVRLSPARQAQYLNEAEYLAWRDPRVKTFSQYLLEDAPPAGAARISSFASGLEFANGAKKPSFAAYRLPIWLPRTSAHGGRQLEVWGCARPAKRYPRTAGPVRIQLNGRTIRAVEVTNPEGYFDVRVRFPHGGTVRLAWSYPRGATVYSRSVTIQVAGAPVTSDLGLILSILGGVLLLAGAVLWLGLLRPKTRRVVARR